MKLWISSTLKMCAVLSNISKLASLMLWVALATLCCTGCHPKSCEIEPRIVYIPPERFIKRLPDCFAPLTQQELSTDWGKELQIGNTFARDLDLYRAITCYKRALVLISTDSNERRLQIEYNLVLSYYLGGKNLEAIDVFENSQLARVPASFPGFETLLIVLHDAYQQLGNDVKACAILRLIEEQNPEKARDLRLSYAMAHAQIDTAESLLESHPLGSTISTQWLGCYEMQAKSVKKAQMLNAVLPGAGFYYVDQKRAALTSFLINAVFIATTAQLAHKGYIAPAIITGSLEVGWYLGGINGAGLAVKTYNEVLYNETTKETMIQHRLFPILMFQCAF